MRALFLALLPFLGSCMSTSSLSVSAGQRSIDDFDVAEDQTTFGAEWLWGILPWGLGLEVGALYSEDDDDTRILGSRVSVDSTVAEGYVGARKTFREDHRLRPYIGAGGAYIWTDLDTGGAVDIDDDDGAAALYAHAGVAYHFAVFHFGVDYRVLTADEVDLAGEDAELDYQLVSVFAGFSF